MTRAFLRLQLLLWLCWLTTAPGQAQILSVTGQYRITEIDPPQQRFGVALLGDDPHKTQRWVYVQPTTEIHFHLNSKEGWTKDEKMNYYQFFNQIHAGSVVKVHGGRRWDGGISCKNLFIGDFFHPSGLPADLH